MPSEAIRIQSPIADLAAITPDADRIAEMAASAWREIHAVLSPVIGAGGFAALHQRSLYLTRAAYPWLAGVREDGERPGDFAGLQMVLSQQTGAQAAAANGALLETFCNLLASLIGVSLTERLLQSVNSFPSGGLAVQDRSV